MTTHDDYLRSLDELTEAISASDNARASSQRQYKTRLEDIERTQRTQLERLQDRARQSALDYVGASSTLQKGEASNLGVKLPERVRAQGTSENIDQAMRQQSIAASKLALAIAEYEESLRVKPSTNEAALALAARRAALMQKPRPALAAVPESTPELKNGLSPLVKKLLTVTSAAIALITLLVILAVQVPSAFVAALIFLLLAGAGVWIRLFLKKRPEKSRAHSATSRKKSASGQPHSTPPAPTDGILKQATRPGTMTGFEPKALANMKLVPRPLMHGEPGSGLSDAGFEAQAIKVGQLGETNFAKALAKEGLLDRFASFWSIHMIGRDRVTKQDADVDCVLVTGNTIWLLDVKYYSSGDVTYRTDDNLFYTIDVATGQLVGQPKKMSKNMKMAIERFGDRFQHFYRHFRVESRVVLIPTNSGMGRIEGALWPGGIRVQTLLEILEELRQQPSFTESLESELVRKTFTGLVKQ